jgi:hypothetical protein
MRHDHRVTAILLVFLFLWPDFDTPLLAQNAPLTPQELDQLLSPIALYPDSLLSQIMTASTNPQEILDVDNWLSANPGLSGTALTDAAQQQGFDPAFIALVNFPQVLEMMAQHIDDYAAIGEAFTADQNAVTNSIQRLRAQAYAAGTLRSNAQQTVEVQQGPPGQPIYVIQPANPQVVYVPQYDPTVVYAPSTTGPVTVAPLIAFGAGITIGALLMNQPWGWGGWAWNWRTGRVYYNHAVWAGWGRPYRPPSHWYRPRPIIWTHSPGYRGNWNYRPPNYRPPLPGNRSGYARPPYNPVNRPGYRPSGNRPVASPTPGASRPNPTPPRANPNPSRPNRNPPRSNPNPPRPNPNTPRSNRNPSQPSRPQGSPSGSRPPAQAPSRTNPPRGGNRPTHQSRPTPPPNHQGKPPSKPPRNTKHG